MEAMGMQKMRALTFTVLLALTANAGTPAQAISLGSTPPTIIVRNKPSIPLTAIYVIYSGSLSEMVVAEQEVAKIFAASGVTIMGASADISDASELQNTAVGERVARRLEPLGNQVGIFQAKIVRIAGSEITFTMTLKAVGTGEIAAGEVLINTENQPTFSDSAAQSLRIAIRNATKRFLTNKQIRPMFAR